MIAVLVIRSIMTTATNPPIPFFNLDATLVQPDSYVQLERVKAGNTDDEDNFYVTYLSGDTQHTEQISYTSYCMLRPHVKVRNPDRDELIELNKLADALE